MLETLRSDLRFASRMLWKSPLFTAVAVVCIAVGSGAVTTIYSAMNAMVLRALPGTAEGDRLVRIERKRPGGDDGVSLSYPWYREIRDRSRTLDGVIAWSKVPLVLRGGSDAGDAIYGSIVSVNLFPVLGIRPLLGRFFSPDEDRSGGASPVLVVSERYWRAHLGADTAAIGRDLLVNGHRATLIGVAPAAFQGMDTPIRSDAWVPLGMLALVQPGAPDLEDGRATWLRAAARLAPGAGLQPARQELSALGQALVDEGAGSADYREYSELRLSPLMGLPPDATGPLAGFLALLLGAAILVLVIASVNVAAMLSARAVHRRREMAVRAALGAARGRLARQLLTEILLLFSLGAVGGAFVALAATRALEQIPIPADVPIQLTLTPDPRVLAFTLLISLLMGVVVGLAPVRRALAPDVAARLREGSAGGGARRSAAGSAIIVGQLAISLVLLLGAGLLGRGLLRATRVDPGFDTDGVLTVGLNTEAWGFSEAEGRRFYTALDQRLVTLPGVTTVSATTILPLNFHSSGDAIERDGEPGRNVDIQQILVGPGYFDALRLPLLSGRGIGAQDDARAGRVAVVNETMARKFWPEGALGRSFRYHGVPVTIVGIARDARYASLTETTPALAYFSLAQEWRAQRNLLIRGSADPRALAPAVARAIRETDAAAPRMEVLPLAAATGVALLPGRVAAMVTGVLGLAGVLLSIAGLYGVVAYSAARRTREIGIRLALGAQRADVLRLIVREGMRLTLFGMVIGLGLAALAAPLLRSLLFGMSPLDPGTFLLMPAALASVALLASYLPARRAAATEPMVVLRGE
jgi:predicted permease